MLKNFKKEVQHEMDAVVIFIKLAIKAQYLGYPTVANYFITKAKEDCGHAFNYAKELDKVGEMEVEGVFSISDIVKTYEELEIGAVPRLHKMYAEVSESDVFGLKPYVLELTNDHSKEAYLAKKLLQQVEVLEKTKAITDIEELFKHLMD